MKKDIYNNYLTPLSIRTLQVLDNYEEAPVRALKILCPVAVGTTVSAANDEIRQNFTDYFAKAQELIVNRAKYISLSHLASCPTLNILNYQNLLI